MAAVVASGGLAAVLWQERLPAQLFQPQLEPDQLLQLFAALHATCIVLALRRDPSDVHQKLASVRLEVRRFALMATGTTLCVLVGYAASTVMPAEPGALFLRNVVAYTGAGLLLSAGSTVAAIGSVWLWLVLSMSVGRSLDAGSLAFEWWAYPLHDAGARPEVAPVLLVAGVVARTFR